MDQELFIALLNPSLSAVLSAAFFVLWMMRRQWHYVLQLSLCYGMIAAGFVLQGFQVGLGFEGSKLVSNVLFFAAVFLFIAAIVDRQKLPLPKWPLLVSAAAGLSAFTWFLIVAPNFAARIFAVNYGLGAMCAVGVLTLAQAKSPTPVDRLLTWLAALRALDFFVRPAVVALFDGQAGQMSLTSSAYWLTTSLSVVIASLLFALTLLTAIASDIIQEFRTESATDALSGLLNRRGLAERALPYFGRGKLGAAPLGLVLADLDHFKAVNDLHGHATGDAVIVSFSRLLTDVAGGRAIVGRTGGEEFAILLPHCDLAMTRLLAEGVRTGLADGGLEDVTPDLGRITCSFGVATRIGDESLEALFKRADDALMQAKRAGRDRVRVTYVQPDMNACLQPDTDAWAGAAERRVGA
ncbi:diguanylate cyclase [Mesorhizobium sp. ASY16-5R]|uniref:GGDEF domain-containing protein n=1 Tax=Mesorhizobium sp. ASY16-5R TaxID=3445772 RepID=UPI003FA10F9C